jgi:hypothetical protein
MAKVEIIAVEPAENIAGHASKALIDVQNAPVVRPEFVVRSCRRVALPLDDFPRLNRVRVLRLGHDSNARIFCQQARCPSGLILSP